MLELSGEAGRKVEDGDGARLVWVFSGGYDFGRTNFPCLSFFGLLPVYISKVQQIYNPTLRNCQCPDLNITIARLYSVESSLEIARHSVLAVVTENLRREQYGRWN